MRAIRVLKFFLIFTALTPGNTATSRAALYEIAFNDGNGNVGAGQIDVESSGQNFYAASGSLTMTGSAGGEWTLYTAGGHANFPDFLTSPAGAYWYNNAVYPTANPQYAQGLLDDYGLLFTQGNGNELNLWGNADGSMTLGGDIGGYQNFQTDISFGGATIEAVPEPSNFIAGALAFIPIGVGVFARRKK